MSWRVGTDREAHERTAGAFLRQDPVGNTVALGLLAGLAAGASWGEGTPVFAVHHAGEPRGDDSRVDAAALMTPPFPLLVSGDAATIDAAGLVAAIETLAPLPGVNAVEPVAELVARAWTDVHGGDATPDLRMHLLELLRFTPPAADHLPSGRARPALDTDADALGVLLDAMQDELGEPHTGNPQLGRRIAARLTWIWEVGGEPVATATATEPVAGVARIVGVYTVPSHRGHGVGGAVTAACVGARLAAGVPRLCLFTDAANPTSNGIYERLGFRRRPADQLRFLFTEPTT